MQQITEEDRLKLAKLARKIGSENAKTLLSVLGKDKPFMDAIQLPIGQELLKDLIFSIEKRLDIILNEKDTPDTRAELRAFKEILRSWTKRINKYEQNKEKLIKGLK